MTVPTPIPNVHDTSYPEPATTDRDQREAISFGRAFLIALPWALAGWSIFGALIIGILLLAAR